MFSQEWLALPIDMYSSKSGKIFSYTYIFPEVVNPCLYTYIRLEVVILCLSELSLP